MNGKKIRDFLRTFRSGGAVLSLAATATPLGQGGLEGIANQILGWLPSLTILGWAVAGATWIAAVLTKHFSGTSKGLKEQAHRSMDDVMILAILLTVGVGVLTFIYGLVSGAFGSSSTPPTWG